MNSISPFAQLAYFFLSTLVSTAAPDQDAVRNALVATSDRWFIWLIASTIAVGIGVLGEIPECLYEWKEWRSRKNKVPFVEKHERWSIPVGVIGAILVAVGIAVEGIAEYNGATAETALRKLDGDRVTKAQKDAGSAAQSAKIAEEAAGSAQKKADAVALQAEVLSALLRAMTPRGVLIDSAENDLVRKLKPFAGQKLVVEECGKFVSPMDRDTEEKTGAMAAMGRILFDEAKWARFPPQYWILDNCTSWTGITVWFNKSAPPQTKTAARTLSREVDKIVSPTPPFAGSLVTVGPELLGLKYDKYSPGELVSNNPALVVVVVGKSPIPWASPDKMKKARAKMRAKQY